MNQPMPDGAANKPLCKDAWAIPPSPRMLDHGNDYYTCSKCGEKVDVVDLKKEITPAAIDIRAALSEILVNWNMPTRQVAISEMMQAFTAAVETALITELEQIAKMNGATKVPSPLVAEYVSERLAEMVGKTKEGESDE